MIIGPKANVAEIAATYQAAYPNARILYASEKDFSAANRVRFFNNIKNNDYDCVIMSHDQFGKIPQSPELQQRILQAELDTVEGKNSKCCVSRDGTSPVPCSNLLYLKFYLGQYWKNTLNSVF